MLAPIINSASDDFPDDPVALRKKNASFFATSKKIKICQTADLAYAPSEDIGSVQYAIFDVGNEELGPSQILNAQEESGLCSRVLLSSKTRPLDLKVRYGCLETNGPDVLIHLEKPCSFSLLCFDRPLFQVSMTKNSVTSRIGSIKHFAGFCEEKFGVFDFEDKLKYLIYAPCQAATCFARAPCVSCKNLEMQVIDSEEKEVGKLTRKVNPEISCLKQRTDELTLELGFTESVEERALLIATALAVDIIALRRRREPFPK